MGKIRANIFINALAGLFFLLYFAGINTSASESHSKDWRAEGLLFLSVEELLNVPVVTASKKEEASFYAPGTVYIITEEEIKRYGWRYLQDALKYIPSVYLYDPHSWVWGGQRGLVSNFSQTLLMINGREVNNLIASEGFISRQFATHNIKRIEVMASPGSALYGANALAGVINIITKELDPSYEGIEIGLEMGSFNSEAIDIVFGQKFGNVRVSGSARYSSSDEEDYSAFVRDTENYSKGWADNGLANNYLNDYDNPSRSRPVNIQIDLNDFYLGMNSYYNRQSHGLEKLRWNYTDGEDHREMELIYGGLNHKIDSEKKIKVEFQRTKSKLWGKYHAGLWPVSRLQAPDTITLNTDPLPGACSASTSYADCLVTLGVIDPDNITDADIQKYFTHIYTNKNDRGSMREKLEIQYDWQINDRTGLITGYTYDVINYTGLAVTDAATGIGATYEIPIDISKRKDVYGSRKYGIFAQAKNELKIDELWLTAGVRYDSQNHYGSSTNPRAGLVWQADERRIVKFLYGESFREPNVFELSSDPDVKPAKLRSFEINYSQMISDQSRLFLAGYHNRVKNFLGSVGSIIGTGVGSVQEQKVVGAEFRIDTKWKRWNSFINGSFILDAEQDYIDSGTGSKSTQDVLSIPEERFNVGMSYNLTDNHALSLVYSFTNSYEANSGNSSVTDTQKINSASDLSASLSATDIAISTFKVDAFLTVTNLLNNEIYQANIRHSGPNKFLQDGRAINVRLVTKW